MLCSFYNKTEGRILFNDALNTFSYGYIASDYNKTLIGNSKLKQKQLKIIIIILFFKMSRSCNYLFYLIICNK